MLNCVSEEYTVSIFVVEEISSTLKMEAVRSSETFINIHQTTWRHIPENSDPHGNGSEDLKAQNDFFY
jgi:hypothetical protein